MYFMPSRFFSKNFITFSGLFLLVLAVPLIVFNLQQKQETRQQAAGGVPHAQGAQIVDGSGNPILLRGAMMESAFAYIKPWQAGQNPLDTLNTKTFTAMHSWGMNALRMNISNWIYN